jgi:TolA-binding protein
LSEKGDYKLTDSDLEKTAEVATDYLKGVNDGSIEASAGIRNGMLHMLGGSINVLMNEKKYADNDTYGDFSDAFIEMAKDSYLLSEEDGGSTSLQSSVINVLTGMKNTATANGNDALAKQCKDTLLNEDFDVSSFLEKAKEESGTTTNADYGAFLCSAMANLAKINLENDTGDVSISDVKDIISTIKTWVSNSDNLLNMRIMSWQQDLYDAVADLAKELYQKDADIDDSVGEDLAAIFKTAVGLKDSTVKEQGIEAAKETADALRENGFKDAANKITLAVATSSETLTTAAWDAYNDKDYDSAKIFADKVIEDYADEAAEQQESLDDYAAAGKESDYWALNDVATAYFILGKSALEKGDEDKAKEYFNKIVDSYGYAQCYDPDTKSYWKVKEAAQKELDKL